LLKKLLLKNRQPKKALKKALKRNRRNSVPLAR
jgi:hypothetical protein